MSKLAALPGAGKVNAVQCIVYNTPSGLFIKLVKRVGAVCS